MPEKEKRNAPGEERFNKGELNSNTRLISYDLCHILALLDHICKHKSQDMTPTISVYLTQYVDYAAFTTSGSDS